MSLRQQNAGSIIKPGFNPLAAPTPLYTYYLYSWGQNTYGQQGNGNITNSSSPNQVGSLTDWLLVASGNYASFGVKTNNTLWSWGNNGSGQLGQGNTSSYSSPKQVGALTNWLTIASGYAQTLAIKTDGTLWGWGKNDYGQLGLGNITNYSSPKQIGALTTWLTIAAGYSHCTAIKTDGTLWAWGRNQAGALGLGNTTNYSSPKQIGSLTTWLKVAAGGYTGYTLAVKTDGTLWSWGGNNYGQQGRGNTTQTQSPNQVGALTDWSNVVSSVQGDFVVATKSNGTLWAWGRNQVGQLADGTITYRSSPVQIGALTTWLQAACGYRHAVSVQTGGTLWSWGYGLYGQLGLNNRTNYSSPKQIGSLTNWAKPTCGSGTSLALGY